MLDHEPMWGDRNGSSSTEVAPETRSISQKEPLKHQEPHMGVARAPGSTDSCTRDAKKSSHTLATLFFCEVCLYLIIKLQSIYINIRVSKHLHPPPPTKLDLSGFFPKFYYYKKKKKR